MAFSRKKFPLFAYISVVVLCFFLAGCQDSNRATKLGSVMPAAENLEEVPPLQVPSTFTPDSAQLLSEKLDSIISQLHKKKGFNGTVLVTKYNQVVYKGAFGYADFYRKDSLTTETVFQLASVSKQFTAMAIMMLKEQGKLHYDDSVQQYLPGFPYSGITIRQLLTHRSGLSNYTYFSEQFWPDRKAGMTNEDVLDMMAAHQPERYHQPNKHFDYSNTGYALLASVVEKASGMPFATFMHKNIFDPLKMNSTFTFGDSIRAQKAKVATGHTGGRRKRTSDYLDTVLGDKGIFSTVDDLYKWDQALYTNKLVKQETLEEAFIGYSPKKRKKEDYGFGWRICELESGEKVVYHAGLWHGYTTYLMRNPKDHSAVILLSNLPNGSLKHLKNDLQEFLYPAQPGSIAKEGKGKNETVAGAAQAEGDSGKLEGSL